MELKYLTEQRSENQEKMQKIKKSLKSLIILEHIT